jgi:hypothetical protein
VTLPAGLAAKLAAFEPSPRSKVGRMFRSQGVRESAEFRRIANLPRRTLAPEALDALAAELAPLVTRPGSAWTLRPVQAWALDELARRGGLLASILVGGGKTLISALAPLALDSRRAVLLVPARLRGKTRADFEVLAREFAIEVLPEIVSYESLGRVSGADTLDALAPDLVIADEAHRLKNRSAACTRRVGRYLEASRARFVAMSGTLTSRKLEEFAHLSAWALGDASPLPRTYADLTEWGLAVDEQIDPGAQRLDAGALRALWSPAEVQVSRDVDEIEASRRAVRRRIAETPGVVTTADRPVGASLSIALVPMLGAATMDADFATLRGAWETPDGHPLADASAVWRHAGELAAGFFYVWDPRPPREWLDARRAWSQVCRHVLATNRSEIDSELQLVQAIDRGDYAGKRAQAGGLTLGVGTIPETLEAWRAIRETFRPNSTPVWRSDFLAEFVGEWFKGGPGIVWVHHVAVGERLAERLGVPYFGRGGLDLRTGKSIETANGAACIASIASCGEGRNLQAWARNLVITPPKSGATWEQLIGRTHRAGQRADEVQVEIAIACREHVEAFDQARADAAYIQSTTGQDQKLIYADCLGYPFPTMNGPRWA